MKKGLEKRQDFIQTAETLFCRQGYENTSIQQILDVLHTSKGSFYHHFESKEQLLEEICIRRSRTITERIISDAESEDNPLQAMNTLLNGLIPLNGEKLSFLLMLLPVFTLAEGWSVQHVYCRELAQSLHPALKGILEKGKEETFFSPQDTAITSEIVLMLTNELWCSMCEVIIASEKSGTIADPSELLNLANAYRTAIERLLYAPYGSIELVNLSDIKSLSEQIHAHWKE